ncbi:MAG: hypothetical protein K6A36_00370 [Paludibacteraceae bacterium]|nr:hypothetical protein [Paludibacteraceae bacterium]
MRKSRYILAVLVLLATVVAVHAQDQERLCARSINGTARYMGMCGAMTAIGGDPTAANDNPAGLGLYRRSELMFTVNWDFDYCKQQYAPMSESSRRVTLPQASWVFAIDNDAYREKGVLYNNLMISYRRLYTYNRTYRARGTEGVSLGSVLMNTGVDFGMPYAADLYNVEHLLDVDEYGNVGEYSIDWAMNISHRLYLGMGLRLQSYTFNSVGNYYELFNRMNADGLPYDLQDSSWMILSGVTCSFAFGAIYRPAQWARLGFAIHTPSMGSTHFDSEGTLSSMTDSLRYSYAPELVESSKSFHMPLHISTGVAFQLWNIGMWSLQYDYLHPKSGALDIHSLRTGLEVVPTGGLYINLGYAYESTFKPNNYRVPIDPTVERQDAYFQHTQSTQYVSTAIGYRGYYIIAQMAYQYRWQKIDLYAHENVAQPYHINTDTHRIVLTLAWHRDNP